MKTPNGCKPVRIKPETHTLLKDYCKSRGMTVEFVADKLIREGLDKLINDVAVQTMQNHAKEESPNE